MVFLGRSSSVLTGFYFGQMFHLYPIIGTYCQLLDGRPIIANYWFPFFHGKQAGRRTKRNMCTNTQKPNPPRPPGTSCCHTIPFSPSRPNLISKTVPETCTKSRDHLVKIEQHEIKKQLAIFPLVHEMSDQDEPCS